MSASSLCMGAGLGAGLMYLFDPQLGRRRRALMLDQVHSATCELGDAIDVGWRDASNRAFGTVAGIRSNFTTHDNSDPVLEARVRSKAGHYVSHPAALEVSVHNGCVVLAGQILADEVQPLLRQLKSLPGVECIEDHLDVHETADNVPGLQGGRQPVDERSVLLQRNCSPATRLLVGSLGGALALSCVGSRGLSAALWGTLGVGLLACAMTTAGSQPARRRQQPAAEPPETDEPHAEQRHKQVPDTVNSERFTGPALTEQWRAQIET